MLADRAELLNRAGSYFLWEGEYSDAERVLREAVAIRERVCGAEHLDTAGSLEHLAEALARQDLEGARPLAERVLTIRERLLGTEHRDTARSMFKLARLVLKDGDKVKGQSLYERALTIKEQSLDDPAELYVLILDLLKLLLSQGDRVGARLLLERYVARYVAVFGSTSLKTNHVRAIVAGSLLEMDFKAEALALSETALAAHEKALGWDHRETKACARVAANALEALGRPEEAKALRERPRLKTSNI
jgi:tetratricopeptide (TPR) repeat protein